MSTRPSRWTILHTEASLGWGGQEIRILSECQWMRAQGHHVVIAASRESALHKRAGEQGFELFHLPFKQATQPLDAARLAAFLLKLKPDFIGTHSSSDTWAGLSAATLARIPGRVRYRHVSTPVRPTAINRLQYRQLADHIITTGECIRGPLIESLGVDPEKVTVVATGITPPAFTFDREQARLALAEKLKLPSSARFIGSVAVLRSWKGHTVLMDAFDQLASRFPDHHLVLAGDGPGREPFEGYKARLDARDRIHFPGHQSDPWPFFRAFDLSVLASVKNEGIPQSLLQAMFAESPVVGTTVGGIPEIVADAKTGFLVPPSDSKALAQAIAATLQNETATLQRVRAAKEFVHAHHTWNKMGEKVTAIFEAILQRKGRA
ncbi:MAG TPA: glycosyltransferase [Methylomirabilota bacterium]|nr:glycosyltransferase [Methylomirabilota bacterium]